MTIENSTTADTPPRDMASGDKNAIWARRALWALACLMITPLVLVIPLTLRATRGMPRPVRILLVLATTSAAFLLAILYVVAQTSMT